MNTIHAAVIHKLDKQTHQPSTIRLRDSLLPVGAELQKLIDNVHDMYSKATARAYGKFHTDDVNYPTSKILRQVFGIKDKSFYDASIELMSTLKAHADNASLATGAFVLMTHVTNTNGHDFFIAAMLSNAEGSAIDATTFEVISSTHIDIKDMRMAGRVNLSEWLSESENRYVNFMKPKGELSTYFSKFLACDVILEGNVETKKLVQAVKSFAKAQASMTDDEENKFYSLVDEHCRDCIGRSAPIDLSVLCNAAWPSNPDSLAEYLANYEGGVTDGFTPQKDGLKSLKKIRGKTKFWNLSIDREALQQGYATYNDDGTLTLLKLSDELKAELS